MTFRRTGGLVALVLQLTVAMAAQNAGQGDKQFQAALQMEMVAGDCKGAIEQYRAITIRPGVSRPLAAEALLRMAGCHEKLGRPEARSIYEQLLKDYSDQSQIAAQAKASLGPTERAGSNVSIERLWATTGREQIVGRVFADGRYLPYLVWQQGPPGGADLFVRDLTNGSQRRVTETTERASTREAAVSRDGRLVAFGWHVADRVELRAVDLAEPGIPKPRTVWSNDDVSQIAVSDWSPDGQAVAVRLRRRDGSAQVAIVSMSRGELRVLQSVDWQASGPLFSPDGRHVVFDRAAGPQSSRRDIDMIAIDGTRGATLVTHPADDAVAGWSPDGALLFTSDRTESVSLWRVAVANGASRGEPELVRSSFVDQPLGTTSTGSVYALSYTSQLAGAFSEIYAAPFDFEAGQFAGKPVQAIHDHVGTNGAPDWSADGSQLAYVSQRADVKSIVVRSASGDVIRVLKPDMTLYGGSMELIRWSPDGRSFAAEGYDARNREGLFRIDSMTGRVTSLTIVGPHDENVRSAAWSRDGSKLYFHRRLKRAPGVEETTRDAIVELDLASSQERTVYRGRFWDMYMSPDGRSFAIRRFILRQSAEVVWTVVPVNGGEPTPLMDATEFWAWAPDSRSVWLLRGPRTSREVWRAPVDGSPAQRVALQLDPAAGRPRVHPDGKRLVFETRTPSKPRDVIVFRNVSR